MSAYIIFILLVFLFFTGCIFGWILEFFFRRFISGANPERLWLNPGFLTGPWLPLYGTGVVFLYLLSLLEKQVGFFSDIPVLHYGILFVIMALLMTLIEYIAGVIFINGMHIKLWDYSKEWGNIQGVICPRFTVIWGVLSAGYYFFLFPQFQKLVGWFGAHPWFSFVVGTLFGLFIVDCAVSIHLGTKIKQRAKEVDRKAVVNFTQMQQKLHLQHVSIHNTTFFSNKVEQFEQFVHRAPGR